MKIILLIFIFLNFVYFVNENEIDSFKFYFFLTLWAYIFMSTCLFHSLFVYNSYNTVLAAGMSGQGASPFPLRSLVAKGASSQGSCTFGPTSQHLPAWCLLHQGQKAAETIWCCWIASVFLVCTFMGVKLCFVWRGKIYFKSIILSVCQIAWVMYF